MEIDLQKVLLKVFLLFFCCVFVRRLCDFIEVMMEDDAINNASILCAQCSSKCKDLRISDYFKSNLHTSLTCN